MSGSSGCNARYSGRSGDWDGEEATALAISWSGPDFATDFAIADGLDPVLGAHRLSGPAAGLLRSLKAQMDPQGRISPGVLGL
jgi:hypothetical protein